MEFALLELLNQQVWAQLGQVQVKFDARLLLFCLIVVYFGKTQLNILPKLSCNVPTEIAIDSTVRHGVTCTSFCCEK